IEPSDWGYPKHRDTKSHDYRIKGNRFANVSEALKIVNTTAFDTAMVLLSSTVKDVCDPATLVSRELWTLFASRIPTAAARAVPLSPLAQLDRSAIIVDEWGPFDWRSPKLWPIDSTHATPLRLHVLGPQGTWRILTRRGVSAVSAESGRVGDTLVVTPATVDDWAVQLEYRGAATVSPSGERRASDVPYRFSYEHFEPHTEWAVRFFRWPDSTAKMLSVAQFDSLRAGTPLLTRRESRLDYMWYRPTIVGLPQLRFAAEGSTSIALGPGVYTLRTISDDAIRVWVDGKLVIDDWTPHESAVDNVSVSGGHHDIRVEYAQVDGWTELRVEIVRGVQRSKGSPGPH
ncbi:MAG: PA14 domain-containing protein, partial [bacterium]